MVWFRVDDGWHSHPKVLELSLSACGLWAKAGSWSADHLTDGFVPAAAVRSLGGTAKMAAELVAAGLWTAADGGWRFHQWEHHQPSRESVERERLQKRDRQRRWRESNPSTDTSRDSSTNELRDALVSLPPRARSPVPSRPDPTSGESAPSAPTRKRAPNKSPLPADWIPNAAHDTFATANSLDLNHERESFRDHQAAKGLVYADHDAAFRTWMRNAVKFRAERGGAVVTETRGLAYREWVPPVAPAGFQEPTEFPTMREAGK